MKKSSLGKRAVAGACALSLALSMPVLAFGTGEEAPATDQQALAEAVADEAAPETVLDGTTASTTISPDDSGLSVQPSTDPDAATTDDLEVTVEYEVDGSITTQDELDAAIEENGPVIEQVATKSEAFEQIKTDASKVEGTEADKAAAAELISSPDNYISANTFQIDLAGQDDTTTTVTVVYAPDANAENVSCYAYYTVTKGGVTINKVEKLTLGADGKYTLELEGQTAEVTFVLANSKTSIAAASATTNKSNGGDAENGYDLVYTTGETKALLGNGQLNWSAQATADVHQADETGVAAYLSIAATEGEGSASASYTSFALHNRFDYAKLINVTASTTADPEDVTNAKITANVGAANRSVRVFYTIVEDGKTVGKYRDLTSDASGNVAFDGVTPGTVYTFAVAPTGQTPSDPSTPDVPVIPDQPVNPDQPNQPIIPNDPSVDGTGEGDGAVSNGAAAADTGATSPKTGIFA